MGLPPLSALLRFLAFLCFLLAAYGFFVRASINSAGLVALGLALWVLSTLENSR